MHTAVLTNPISGRGRARDAGAAAASLLREAGHTVECLETTPEHGAFEVAAAVAARAQLVVVAGGDGTLRETVAGLGDAASRVRIALIPLGNANVIARELGIPLATDAAIRTIVSETTRTLDVGEVTLTDQLERRTPELFLAMVGIGWDAQIVRRIDRIRHSALGRRWYGWWGDSVYFVAGVLASLRRQPRDLELEVDGDRISERFRAALLCNSRGYGKGWSMTPAASCRDGKLDYQARKRSALPWLLAHLLAAIFSRTCPRFVSHHGAGRRLRMQSARQLAVQVDGDDRGDATCVEVILRPTQLQIVCPPTDPF